jgi:hypothetical protein
MQREEAHLTGWLADSQRGRPLGSEEQIAHMSAKNSSLGWGGLWLAPS